MSNDIFVASLALSCAAMLWWGCVALTCEERQIIASVPVSRNAAGSWTGMNFTWYGFILASAQCAALTLFCVMMGSLGFPLWKIGLPAAMMLAVCVPASKVIARLVERKKGTFTVGGASFIGFMISPLIVAGINASGFMSLPVMPFLSALAVSYAFGEGMGRLGCISFGCCYGKPVAGCHPFIGRLFRRFHFRFSGSLKKAAYEGALGGEPVIPVQALTSAVYFASGILSIYLFLHGSYRLSFLVAVICTQSWRFVSEFLRADYRGEGRISVYQFMSLAMIAWSVMIVFYLKADPARHAQILEGMKNIATVPYIIFIEIVWSILFIFLGKSVVTGSELHLFLNRDRI